MTRRTRADYTTARHGIAAVHLAAHGCEACPEYVLRQAGIRYSEDGQAA